MKKELQALDQFNTKSAALWNAWVSAWNHMRPVLLQADFKLLVWIGAIVLPILFAADIFAGMMKHFDRLPEGWAATLRISEDKSAAEFFGYLMLQMSVFFCLALGWRLRANLHFALAVVLQYLILDDMLAIHELAGSNLVVMLGLDAGAGASQDMGELIYALAACVIFAGLFAAYFRRSTYSQQSLFLMLMIPFTILGGFAVGLDFLHGFVPRDAKYLDGILALAEDGGELCAMYVLMLVAAAQWMSFAAPGPQTSLSMRRP